MTAHGGYAPPLAGDGEPDQDRAAVDRFLAASHPGGSALVVLGPSAAAVDDLVRRITRRWPHPERPHVATARPGDQGASGRLAEALASGLTGRIGASLAARVERQRADGPVLLAVTDAQWADRSSLEQLAALVERADGPGPSVVVGAVPTVEVVRWADRLAAAGRAEVVELPLVASDGGARPAGPYDPGSRTADEREVLLAVALLGRPAALSDVEALAGLGAGPTAATVDALAADGLLEPVGAGRLGLAGVDAASVLQAEGPGRRALAHRRAFDLLHQRGALAAAAPHALEGDLAGDPRAVAATVAEAEQALGRGAVEEAVIWSAGALRLAGSGAHTRELRLHADALVAAGRPAAAADAYRAAIARADPPAAPELVDLLRRLARALAYAGDLVGSTAASDEAWSRSIAAPDLRAEIAVDHVHAVWQQEGPSGALPRLERYEATGELPATPGVAVMAGYVRLWARPSVDAADRLVEAAALVDEPTRSSPFDPILCSTAAARFAERWALDQGVLEREVADAASAGRAHALPAYVVSLADSLIRQGRPDTALELLGRLDGAPYPLLAEAIDSAKAFALLEQGDLDALQALVAHLPDGLMWGSELWVRHYRAAVLLGGREVAAASAEYHHLASRSRELGVGLPEGVPWAEHALDAHAAAGDLAAVEALVAWLDAGALGISVWRPAMAHLGRALLARAGGDLAGAEAHLATAIELGDGRPLVRARLLRRWADLRRADGRRADARPLYRAALPVFETARARADAHRCAAGLLAVGGRRAKTAGGPGSLLTAQEHRVATLAAAGRTTREIGEALYISPKTVETHLRHVFDKVGVRSKRELSARDLGPEPSGP
jgi:DNA-binding CsgD family transcriptional regulator